MTEQNQQVLLPIYGMNCDSCSSRVEKALKEVPGVSHVMVDQNKNLASIGYNPAVTDLIEIRHSVMDAGFTVPTQEIVLSVAGMSCISCLAHVEGALQDLPGVLQADVSLKRGTARVEYIPELATLSEMVAAVQDAGYPAQPIPQGTKTRV